MDRITHSIESRDCQYEPEARMAKYFSAKTVLANLTSKDPEFSMGATSVSIMPI